MDRINLVWMDVVSASGVGLPMNLQKLQLNDRFSLGLQRIKSANYSNKGLRLIGLLLIFCFSCSKSIMPVDSVEVMEQPEKFNVPYGPNIYKPDRSFKVVGYMTFPNSGHGRDHIQKQPLRGIDYLNLSFLNPNFQGDLVGMNDFDIEFAVDYLKQNDVKVFVSLAGGLISNETKANWKRHLNSENRAEFVYKITQFVVNHKLDGVDVDLENNLFDEVGPLYESFVVELAQALHSYGKAITSAMYPISLHRAVTDKALETFDFINVMVYNLRGLWNLNDVGPHSPLSMVDRAYRFWTMEKEIPPEKLVLGVPFYGWDFDRRKAWSYAQIVSMNPQNAYKDNVEKIYYNGLGTIVKKVKKAKKAFSGVMFWQLRQDTTDGLSLIHAIDQTVAALETEIDCEIKFYYPDEDMDGLGNPFKPRVACTQPEGYVTNRDDTDDTTVNENIHSIRVENLKIFNGIR